MFCEPKVSKFGSPPRKQVKNEFLGDSQDSEIIKIPRSLKSEFFGIQESDAMKGIQEEEQEFQNDASWMTSEVRGIECPHIRFHNEILIFCEQFGPN